MAISTENTFLMYKLKSDTTGNLTKLADIKEFPDMGGEPELLETTTLTNHNQTYIPGIQSLDNLTFTTNFDPDEYLALKDNAGKECYFELWHGVDSSGEPDGHNGAHYWDGQYSVFENGGGVNEVINATITVAASSDILFKRTASGSGGGSGGGGG